MTAGSGLLAATLTLGSRRSRAFAAHGGHVIGLARTLEAARDKCRRAGGSTTPVACDLADLDSVIAATNVVHTLPRLLDTLVASAGIGSKELQRGVPDFRQLLLVIFRNGTLT